MILDGKLLEGVRVVSWDVDGTLYSRAALFRRIALACALSGRWRDLRRLRAFHAEVEAQRSGDARVEPMQLQRHQPTRLLEEGLVLHALRQLRPSFAAVSAMRELRERGVRQVALSDFAAEAKLAALGLSEQLSATYVCEELGHWKPSPVAFARLQQEAQVHPSEHLHIGDRLDTDGEGARRAGCRFLQLTG